MSLAPGHAQYFQADNSAIRPSTAQHGRLATTGFSEARCESGGNTRGPVFLPLMPALLCANKRKSQDREETPILASPA